MTFPYIPPRMRILDLDNGWDETCDEETCPDCNHDAKAFTKQTHSATRDQPAEFISKVVCTNCDYEEYE